MTPVDLDDLVTELEVARKVVKGSREVIKAAGELASTTATPNVVPPEPQMPNASARVAYASAAFEAAINELRVAVVAYDQATGGRS